MSENLLKLIMTKGLPASGKSTWAKEVIDQNPEKWKRVNKDDLRAMLDNGQWSNKNEKFVIDMRDMIITIALLEGYSVIVDDTNLHPKHEKRMRSIVESHNNNLLPPPPKVEFEIKDFTDVPLEVCLERDEKRSNSVGPKVIWGMYNQFLNPTRDTPPTGQGSGEETATSDVAHKTLP